MMHPAAFYLYAFIMAFWLITSKASGLLDESWERAGPFFTFWMPIIFTTVLCAMLGIYLPAVR